MLLKRIKLLCVLVVKLIRVFFQVIYGAWRISRLRGPIVTIFGGARTTQDDVYALQATMISQMLVGENISVLTGGGPGIMQAASCGAIQAVPKKGRTIGIGVRRLAEIQNPCVEEYFELDYFFARKYLLTRSSIGFIIFPGGFGTLDELAEILTLIQTGVMVAVPVVLVGKEYWGPLMNWFQDQALTHGLISKKDIELFSITDDPYQAFCLIRGTCSVIQ